MEKFDRQRSFIGIQCTLLYRSVSARPVIGQFSGPYFTVRPTIFKSLRRFMTRALDENRISVSKRYLIDDFSLANAKIHRY